MSRATSVIAVSLDRDAGTSSTWRAWVAAALALPVWLAAAPAQAHDTWLLPGTSEAAPGQSVTLAMTSGMAFPQNESPIDPDRVERSGVRLAGREDASPQLRASEQALMLAAKLDRPGVATVWLDLRPRTIDLTPDDVSHYLEEIGAPPEVIARWKATPEPRRWRESYRKHVKAFVRVGEGGGDRSWAEPVGSPLELVPESDPTALRAGDQLGVRLLRNGAPAAGATVALVRAGETKAVHHTTGADGRATFRIEGGGWHLMRTTDLQPASVGELDWESSFATLTFEAKSGDSRTNTTASR